MLDPAAALAIPGVVDFIDATEFGSENISSVGHTGSDGQVWSKTAIEGTSSCLLPEDGVPD